MKTTELRIGNLFLGIGMIQTVFEIHDNTDRGKIIQSGYEHLILCKENGNQYKPIEIEAIPLTEEWLLKLGFNKLEDGNLRNGMLLVTKNSKDELTVTIRLIMIKSIKHVHQLQNLYFALIGEELVIK
jgi:hypothetical protein